MDDQPTERPDQSGSPGASGSPGRPGPSGRPVDPMALLSYLISGIVLYGGIGWLVDNWLDRSPLFFPIGVVLGVAAGGYLGYMRFLRT